ncbi:MAG TPA: WG repeat-containing protein [Saprospiraceae bacterium]|nr:WG repeat-containing protein [Saprospiraceae bacterium]
MKKLFYLFFSAVFFNFQHAAAQNLIPYLGSSSPMSGEGRYGYATEDGEVVIQPTFKGIHEVMPAGKIFTSLKNVEAERILMRPGQPDMPGTVKAIFLLRSGRRIAADNPRGVVVGVQNYNFAGKKIDSIGHLLVFPKEKEMVFHDLRKNTEKAYLRLVRNNSTDWFSGYYPYGWGYLEPYRFTHGFAEVWKTPGTMNFIDADLKEIFPRDFAAGRVLDAGHFILAEDMYQYAIGDRTGKVRTPFVWTSIQPSGREGLFIVTGPRYNHGKSGITGLIDADGKIVLDTVYRNITPFGNMLIVEKDNKYGLMDFAGNTILPITAREIYPESSKRWLYVIDNDPVGGNMRTNFIDSTGRRLLPDAVRGIGFPGSTPILHYLVQFPEYTAFYDAELKEIARFKGIDNGRIVEVNPLVFQFSKIVGNKYQHGLYDRDGNMLHPEGFDELMRVASGVYRVKKDTLFGVINGKGEIMVPIKYLSVKEYLYANDTLFWCENASGRWDAFNRKGEKLPESGRLDANVYQDPVIGIKSSGYGPVTAILSDGTRMTMPDSLKDWNLARQVHSPSGGLVVFSRYRKGRSESLYFNERMQNVIPPGFVAAADNTETGLVTVLRIKVKPKPATPKPEPESQVETVKEMIKEGGEVVEYGPRDLQFDACGVLSADGKWALPPKAGVTYRPISNYLVLEIPDGVEFKRGRLYPKPLRIHRVNQPPQPVIEVNYIRDDQFERGRKTMQMGRVFPKLRDRMLPAYFDEKGNQLTPFGVWQGPFYLKSLNVISLTNPDDLKEFKHLIINEKGETLFDLKNLFCAKFPHEKGHDWKLDYFVVNERLPDSEAEKWTKMTMQEINDAARKLRIRQGIMDSTGRLVVPMRHLNVQIIAPDRLFGARDTNGVALLYNWQGELLHRFPKVPKMGYQNSDAMNSMSLSGGNIAVTDGMSSVLISADNRMIKTFEEPYTGHSELESRFFQIKDKEGNLVWVRSKDGLVFRRE